MDHYHLVGVAITDLKHGTRIFCLVDDCLAIVAVEGKDLARLSVTGFSVIVANRGEEHYFFVSFRAAPLLGIGHDSR